MDQSLHVTVVTFYQNILYEQILSKVIIVHVYETGNVKSTILQAQDRGTKLYDAYCKFLLSYNDLTPEEKSKLLNQVKAERMKVKREDQEEDCIVKVTGLFIVFFYA